MAKNAYNKVYTEILEDYKKIVDSRLSDSFEYDWNSGKRIALGNVLLNAKNDELDERSTYGNSLDLKWSYMLVDMTDAIENPEKSSFGYFLKDLNDDSIPELFWVRSDGVVLAVFTIHNAQPVLLDAFWPRYKCVITSKDELYTFSSGGAFYNDYDIRILTSEEKLSSIKTFGLAGEASESGVQYYEVVDGAKVSVGEARFNSLLEEYPFISGIKWNDIDIHFLHE